MEYAPEMFAIPKRLLAAAGRAAFPALMLALTVAGQGCRQQAPEAAAPEEAARPAPHFELTALDGQKLGPQSFPGKVVLVDFWATWCTPCHLQGDILRALYPDFDPETVAFLAVSLGEERSVVEEFVERKPFPYPVLLDPEDRLSEELGIYALPTLLILDTEGEVAYFEPGISDGDTLRRLLIEAGAGLAEG